MAHEKAQDNFDEETSQPWQEGCCCCLCWGWCCCHSAATDTPCGRQLRIPLCIKRMENGFQHSKIYVTKAENFGELDIDEDDDEPIVVPDDDDDVDTVDVNGEEGEEISIKDLSDEDLKQYLKLEEQIFLAQTGTCVLETFYLSVGLFERFICYLYFVILIFSVLFLVLLRYIRLCRAGDYIHHQRSEHSLD